MSSRLIDSLATTAALAEVFSDRSILQAMLDFEAALARAEASAGMIPARAAQAIATAATADSFDAADIARGARDSGTVSIPFLKMLTARVQATDPASARFVHFGATSQDVADTAMVLTVRRARTVLAADHERLDAHASGLVRSSCAHGDARAHVASAGPTDHVRPQSRGMGRSVGTKLDAVRARV